MSVSSESLFASTTSISGHDFDNCSFFDQPHVFPFAINVRQYAFPNPARRLRVPLDLSDSSFSDINTVDLDERFGETSDSHSSGSPKVIDVPDAFQPHPPSQPPSHARVSKVEVALILSHDVVNNTVVGGLLEHDYGWITDEAELPLLRCNSRAGPPSWFESRVKRVRIKARSLQRQTKAYDRKHNKDEDIRKESQERGGDKSESKAARPFKLLHVKCRAEPIAMDLMDPDGDAIKEIRFTLLTVSKRHDKETSVDSNEPQVNSESHRFSKPPMLLSFPHADKTEDIAMLIMTTQMRPLPLLTVKVGSPTKSEENTPNEKKFAPTLLQSPQPLQFNSKDIRNSILNTGFQLLKSTYGPERIVDQSPKVSSTETKTGPVVIYDIPFKSGESTPSPVQSNPRSECLHSSHPVSPPNESVAGTPQHESAPPSPTKPKVHTPLVIKLTQPLFVDPRFRFNIPHTRSVRSSTGSSLDSVPLVAPRLHHYIDEAVTAGKWGHLDVLAGLKAREENRVESSLKLLRETEYLSQLSRLKLRNRRANETAQIMGQLVI
ncbi:hypothetical protein BJ742DRAFT_865694 [Cladochytrium replicatum]|nr:hypothetical protein BJ742DRAFT_865694 [Cladochytrium replicatum]